MPSLRLLLQLRSTRVLALLRVPQLLLPQGAGASGAPPARRVGRAAAEQRRCSARASDPGPTAAVEHESPPADAVRQPSVAAAATAAAIVPEAMAARAAAPDAARAAAPAAIPERDALARAFPASLARSGATSGRDPVQDAERKVDQAREAYDAAQGDPKASAGMKFHLYGKMQEAVLPRCWPSPRLLRAAQRLPVAAAVVMVVVVVLVVVVVVACSAVLPQPT